MPSTELWYMSFKSFVVSSRKAIARPDDNPERYEHQMTTQMTTPDGNSDDHLAMSNDNLNDTTR
jgi:hypothetical protein